MPGGTPFHASTPKSIAYICVEWLILMHVAISPLFLNLVQLQKLHNLVIVIMQLIHCS